MWIVVVVFDDVLDEDDDVWDVLGEGGWISWCWMIGTPLFSGAMCAPRGMALLGVLIGWWSVL